MMVELETLRTAYRLIPQEHSVHLQDETWEDLGSGDLIGAERDTAMEHILGCSECAEVYRSLLALKAKAHSFDPSAPVPKTRPQRRVPGAWFRVLAGITGLAAMIVVVLLLFPLTSSPPGFDVLRAAGDLQSPVPLAPVGDISHRPISFSWQAFPDSRAYIVELLDAKGELVWRSGELESLRVQWPSELDDTAGSYYWRVLAVPEDGGRPIASTLVDFALDLSASPQ